MNLSKRTLWVLAILVLAEVTTMPVAMAQPHGGGELEREPEKETKDKTEDVDTGRQKEEPGVRDVAEEAKDEERAAVALSTDRPPLIRRPARRKIRVAGASEKGEERGVSDVAVVEAAGPVERSAEDIDRTADDESEAAEFGPLPELPNGLAESRKAFDALIDGFTKSVLKSSDFLKGFSKKGKIQQALRTALSEIQQRKPSDKPTLARGLDRDLAHHMLEIAAEQNSDALLDADPFNKESPLDSVRQAHEGLLGALAPLSDALEQAKKLKLRIDNKPGNTNQSQVVEDFINEAQRNYDALSAQAGELVAHYPKSLGKDYQPTVDFSQQGVSGGVNEAPRELLFEFDQGQGKVKALFKAEPGSDKEALETTLGELFIVPDNEKEILPLRLSQRAKAMEVTAEKLLNLPGLVVRTELAVANGSNGRFGILMEYADGKAPVESGFLKPLSDESESAQNMAAALDALQNATTPAEKQAAQDNVANVSRLWNVGVSLSKKGKILTKASASLNEAGKKLDEADERKYFSFVEYRRVNASDLQGAELRRDLANAEVLDHLCGQVDRHMRNLTIVTDGDGVSHIVLFDNDLAYGIEDYYRGNPEEDPDPRGKLQALPKAIDRDLAETLLRLTKADLERDLSGLISNAEIDAMAKRLAILQKYIRDRHPTIVTTNQGRAELTWADATPEQLFHNHKGVASEGFRTEKSSYYGEIMSIPVEVEPAEGDDDSQ